MLSDELQHVPIACRIVASDQWLLTRFDPSWKVAELKQYVLSKVNGKDTGGQQYFPPRNRPVSPITFASTGPSRYSLDRSNNGDSDEEEDNDDEVSVDDKYIRPKLWSNDRDLGGSPPPTSYHSLVAFSTGQLLEDDYTLSWYRLQPNELLELHPPGAIINLPRDDTTEYIQPYLEVKVKALRVISHEDAKPKVDNGKIRRPRDNGQPRSPTDRPGQPLRKRKKTKLEWKERWLIVHQGMLNLFKEKSDATPTHTCSLDLLTTLSGPETVLHGPADSLLSPHIVCAKFCSTAQEPMSPLTEAWNDPWSNSPIRREMEQGSNGGGPWTRGSREDIKVRKGSSGGATDAMAEVKSAKDNSSFWYDVDSDSDSDGTWLVLDALEDNAKSNLLRVLHRHHPHNITSSFVPGDTSSSSLLTPPYTAEVFANDSPHSPCPYPDWRRNISSRAQRAGLGDVGQAMSWLMWRQTLQDQETIPVPPPHEPALSSLEFDIDPLADTHEVELEWDSWINDLPRQRRVTSLAEPTTPRPFGALGSDISPDTQSWFQQTEESPGHDPIALPTPLYDDDIQSIPLHLRGPFQDALSADGPALLTTPSIFPLPTSGMTTSTISVGGVVRAHSRTAVNEDGRGRGMPRAMEVVQEGFVSPNKGKGKKEEKKSRRKDRDDEHTQISSFASHSLISAPDVVLPATDGPLDRPSSAKSRSVGLVRKASTTSKLSSTTATSSGPPSVASGPGSSGGDSIPVSVHTSTKTAVAASAASHDTTTTMTTTITGKVEAAGSKGAKRQKKEGFRFKPDRFVKGLDSALDFVDGRL